MRRDNWISVVDNRIKRLEFCSSFFIWKTDFCRYSGFRSDFISSPVDSAYSIYFSCRLWLCFDFKSRKNRFLSDFRFFVGLDFITIEINVVIYPYWAVFMSFQCSLVSITDILFLGNGKAQKPVKMTEIGKSKIQVLIKVGYNLSA